MEWFRISRDIPFMRYALLFNIISLVTFLVAVGSLATRGLHLGVDFTGGTVMEVAYPEAADLDKVRQAVAQLGFTDASVQNFGTSRDVLIRLPVKEGVTSAQLSERVLEQLKKDAPKVEMRRVEFVGPQVGRELFENGALALLLVSIGIVLYLWLRFEWKFGVAAIIAAPASRTSVRRPLSLKDIGATAHVISHPSPAISAKFAARSRHSPTEAVISEVDRSEPSSARQGRAGQLRDPHT